ncbi:MAG: hypothetical protein ACOC37_02660 [Spirochaetota bacterium]
MYFGEYEPGIYTIGDASGKNDTVVPGFEEYVRAALVDGSTSYYVSDDTGDDVQVASVDDTGSVAIAGQLLNREERARMARRMGRTGG